MKFKDMPYKRPDIEQMVAEALQAIDRLKSVGSFEDAEKALAEWDNLYKGMATMARIASVRHHLDVNDEFYIAENDFWDETGPVMDEYVQRFDDELLVSAFRPELEAKYGKVMFLNMELKKKTFKPEIIPLLQRENKLVTEYVKLMAGREISFEGNVYNSSQFGKFKQEADKNRRHNAWKADGDSLNGVVTELDRIYSEMVDLRTKIAKELGFDRYTPLGYCRMSRNSYDEQDVAAFRDAVIKHIVPVAERLEKQRAERIGSEYPVSFADIAPAFMDGDPKPQGEPDDILAHGRKFYHELSPFTAEFIDFMTENELMDVISRKGKAGGGFCTSFPDYDSPFIFANFNGTAGDVEVMTHEGGHAFASYMAREIFPSENKHPSLESCEIHSMSMEFFSWPWAEGFFGKDTRKFMYNHLMGALTFIPYGTMVDHFQHIIYEKPDMSPEQRVEEWRNLIKIYMPWIKFGEVPFYGDGRGWQRQSHIYEVPFYYIDYCLAQTVALQFWVKIQSDTSEAWDRYIKLVRLAGTETFTGLVNAAGLESPFGENALREIGITASKWLDEFKL